MGAENSVGIPNFGMENLSRSFALEQRFRKSGAIGVDQNNTESVVRANVEVSNILNTSFSVGNVAETQLNPVMNYDNVPHMIEVVKNTGLTDRVRKNAENALYEVGFALSQNKEVFKAATEGKLDEILVSGLKGIEPYLLSSYLTKGRGDEAGQKRVEGLVEVFRLKKKVDEFPTERNQKEFKEKIGGFFDTLYEDRENCGAREVSDGTEGRISTIMGYVTTIDESSKTPVVVETNDVNEKFVVAVNNMTAAVEVETSVLGQKLDRASDKLVRVAEQVSNIRTGQNENHQDSQRGNIQRKNNRYETMESIDGEDDPDILRDIARVQLDKIEDREDLSNRYRLDGQPTWVLDEITFRLKNELIDGVKDQLAHAGNNLDLKSSLEERLGKYELLMKEIQARLTIFDIGKLMSDAGYKLGDKGGITDVIGQAANINRIMDREVMGFLFGESKEAGIDIPSAWDFIQDANFNYEKILNEMVNSGFAAGYNGEMDFLYVEDSLVIDRATGKRRKIGLFLDKDINPERAALVEKYILTRLASDPLTGKTAKKAYQLANEIVSATAERSVFNFNLIKADTFADVIYFKAMRDDDARKGKNVGPVASRNIDSLAHGWLRYFSRSSDLTDNMGAICAKDIKVEAIISKEDSVGYFCKVLPAYVLNIKAALMDSDPDLKKVLNLSYLQGLVSAFDKVDIPYRIKEVNGEWVRTSDKSVTTKSRCGIHNMKPLYVLGILELLVTKENLGMNISSIRKLRELLVDTGLSETAKPFLSEAQWKWCLQQKIAHVGKRDLTFIQAIRVNERNAFLDGFWDYFLNGGKQKK